MNRNEPMSYEDFGKLLAQRHDLGVDFSFSIWYTDSDGDPLPINNDNNLARALANAKCLLRIFIHRKGTHSRVVAFLIPYAYISYTCTSNSIAVTIGDGAWDNGYSTMKPKNNLISSILGGTPGKPKSIVISNPHDFRQVSLHLVIHFLTYNFIGRFVHLFAHSLSRYPRLSMLTYCQKPVGVCVY